MPPAGFAPRESLNVFEDQSTSPIARIPELRWLKNIIIERALTRGDYLLAGGARSDYYIDKFKLFADPHVLRRIARLFAPIVSELNPDADRRHRARRRDHRHRGLADDRAADDRRAQATQTVRRVRRRIRRGADRDRPARLCCWRTS